MEKLILGIDAGNHKAKVAGIHGVDSFKTNICNWFERDVLETFGADDMEFTIGNRKGFAGTIAAHEDEFGDGTTYGDSKAHEDTKIRVLLAIHRYINKYCPPSHDPTNVFIVTGQPISRHKEEEKNKIIKMLQGYHDFVVNGQRRKVYIGDVKVTPEASGAYWSKPVDTCKIIDIGSGTVNLAAIASNNHIHKSSGTMNTGMETLKNRNDMEGMARGIVQQATKLKWNKNDRVLVCGGVADQITPYLQKHFTNADVLKPDLKRAYDLITVQPVFANAIGFYNLARGVYQ